VKKRFFATAEVAAMLRVSVGAVRQWVQHGTVLATRMGPRSRYRLRREVIEQLPGSRNRASRLGQGTAA